MKKIRWVILIIVLIACVVLWTQTINVMCDQDVQFFSGICSINKFILVEAIFTLSDVLTWRQW